MDSFLEASRLPLSPVLGISKDFKKGDRVIQPSESYPLGEEMKKKKKKYSISMKDMRESATSTVKFLSEEPRIESCDFTTGTISGCSLKKYVIFFSNFKCNLTDVTRQ